jgi:hypothetical protein
MPDKFVMGFTYVHIPYRKRANQGKIESPAMDKTI